MWTNLNKILAVGIGGFIGSISRYLISGWIQQVSHSILKTMIVPIFSIKYKKQFEI